MNKRTVNNFRNASRFRRTVKGIVRATANQNYRPDLKVVALARLSQQYRAVRNEEKLKKGGAAQAIRQKRRKLVQAKKN